MARDLRSEFTGGELAAWHFLRRNALGVHFTRECVVRGYIVDFACRALALAVEIDGGIHRKAERQKYDSARDERLGFSGWAIIRLSNAMVCSNPARAKDMILEGIARKRSDPSLVGRLQALEPQLPRAALL